MEENALCSLSHTTPKTHISSNISDAPTAMVDEGEDDEIVDGGHGVVMDVPATVTRAGGVSKMVDESVDGELKEGGHGADSTTPTMPPKDEGDSIMEKLKAEFNIKEFFELALRVINEGDSQSMEELKNLKIKWIKKLGPGASFEGQRLYKPFSIVLRRPWVPQSRKLLLRILVSQRLLKPALGLINAALSSCNVEPQLNTSIVTLAAAACDASIVASPRSMPKPLTETSIVAEHGDFQTRPLPPGEAPPVVEVCSPFAMAADRERVLLSSGNPAILEPPRRSVAEMVPAAAGVSSYDAGDGIFIGNVPLHTQGSDFSCDKFAASFNNSTRKTLSYVNPSIQNGEIVVRPSIDDVVREGSRRWDNTAVGYFLGRKPYYYHLNEYVRSVWPDVKTVTATSNGFYFFQFKTEIAMEEVIEGGPWLFQGQPIVLQRWEPGMVLRKHKHTQVPVWIRLRHLPVEFWTDDGLRTVASGVGRPLYQDTITRACTRLDFARVCVMLDISSTLPKHLIIMMPREDGTEVPCKVEVGYEWVPPKCKNCMSLGYSTSACPDARKIDKSPVSVYVQKRTVQPPVSRPDVAKGADRKPRCFRPGSYKQPLAYCYVMNAGIWNVRGLNRRDHQVAVKELVSEFRDCILDTGLIHLPVQGERFSWHNCSEGDRSLWKRLDKLIVNDAWLGQWPCSHYHCLNARTSDHSPLVIRGDIVSHTVITRKLRALKPVFRTLRKKKGNLSMNVKLAAEFLGTVQQLLQTDRHNTLSIRLEKCCKMVFFRATKLEQVMLQQRAKIQWLMSGDQCSRIFFRKVAMRRASKKVFQIANEAGRTLTEQDEVVDEFVSFYQRLLGAECTVLVQRPTREEVKDAFFDIAEDKAPGPDGYSSGFYKAAWPVIGDEVVKAILEFFTTGRLLKQVNTTMLALIPKRLRLVLDAMISPSQNAFVPGRSIGDNILLAQEMFTGYNRQGLPKRCALKVDLRKGI
ncbi:hypothetical protein Sango_2890500 [Sesamum angolense]|uniref:DUF4283 domain-containing protein n=1 Tax=Sesamum angolense TaxID=2727404 RepID=A0AAE1T6S4_9LAMI|nr:hypothetical protein Sango_2890500 [Sesamum angolense]